MVLKLLALVLGEGSVVPLALDPDESVGELRKMLCREQQYTFPASGLTLFAARGVNGSAPATSTWLRADDPLVKALKKGAAPTEALVDEDLEMDPTYPLSEYFSGADAPQLKQIHVLVQLPGAGTPSAATPATPVVRASSPMTPAPSIAARLFASPVVASPQVPGASLAVVPARTMPEPAQPRVPAPAPTPPRAPVVPPAPIAALPRAAASAAPGNHTPAPASTQRALAPSPAAATNAPTSARLTTTPARASPVAPLTDAPAASGSSQRTFPTTQPIRSSSRVSTSGAAAGKPQPKRVVREAPVARPAPATRPAKDRDAASTAPAPVVARPPRTRVAAVSVHQPRAAVPTVHSSSAALTAASASAARSGSSFLQSASTDASSDAVSKPRRTLVTTTWAFKASALFFYFHRELGCRNVLLTCGAFDIAPGTFRNWVGKREFFIKWLPRLRHMTLRDALEHMPPNLYDKFPQLRDLHPDARVVVPPKYHKMLAEDLAAVGCEVNTAIASGKHARSELMTQSIESLRIGGGAMKKARLHSAAVVGSEAVGLAKTIGSGRISKYPVHEAYLVALVRMAWEAGAPLTTAQIYERLRDTFGRRSEAALSVADSEPANAPGAVAEHVQSEFEVRMGLDTGRTAAPLTQWVSRRLVSYDWHVHARYAIPMVPSNWRDIALQTSRDLQNLMRDVDVLVSADEVVISFHEPGEHDQNDSESTRTGCTAMLACELFTSKVLPAFTVVPGGVDGEAVESDSCEPRLQSWTFDPTAAAADLRDLDRPAPPAHWLNAAAAKLYLSQLTVLYPNQQIGLIWDTASSHVDAEVLAHAAELGIIIGFIPPGLGSAMHVCNRVFGHTRVVQKDVLEQFERWKTAQCRPPSSAPTAVERTRVVAWIDAAVTRLQRSMKSGLSVQQAFRVLGQDPTSPPPPSGDDESNAFVAHLQTLEHATLVKALIDSQFALHLQ